MSKKKIFHIIGGLGVGGAETAVINSLKYVNWDEFEFIFVCFGKEQIYDYTEIINSYEGCSIRFINTPRKLNVYSHIKQIRTLVSDVDDISVVHVYTLLHSAIVIRALEPLCNVPVVVHAHSSSDNSNKKGIVRKFYEGYSKRIIQNSSSKFISCGMEAGKYLFSDKRFEVIYNGVDTDMIKKNIITKNNIEDNYTKIVMIGRLINVKNHEFALQAVSHLIKKNKNIKLYIVGEGDLRKHLDEIVINLGISEYVDFLGLRRDVINLMCEMDLLWMPSKFEGFPMVLIESQAVGLPAVVSNKVDELVDLDMDLIKFSPLIITDWLQCTEQVINTNNNSRCYDNTNILEKKGFSSINYAKQMERIYYELIGENKI